MPISRPGRRQRRGQRAGAIGRAVPDRDLADRPHRGVRAHELGRQRAGADHQQPRGIGARQIAARQRRGRARAPGGEPGGVHHRQRLAGLGREQQIGAEHGRLAARGVVGEHRDRLDAEIAPRRLPRPARSPPRPASAAGWPRAGRPARWRGGGAGARSRPCGRPPPGCRRGPDRRGAHRPPRRRRSAWASPRGSQRFTGANCRPAVATWAWRSRDEPVGLGLPALGLGGAPARRAPPARLRHPRGQRRR